MRRRLLLGALLAAALASPPGRGDAGIDAAAEAGGGAATSAERRAQRALYQAALDDLYASRLDAFEAKRARLADYPLLPYLEYYRLLRYISSVDREAIARFRERYAETRLADRVLRHWLESLAREGRWQLYREHYRSDIGDVAHACYYYESLLRTGATQAAHAGARRLWRVAHSQPRACDPLFNAWIEAGGVTDALAWERFTMALGAGNTALARYLVGLLDPDSRELAKRFLVVHVYPRSLRERWRFEDDGPRVRELVAHGLTRLAQRDAMAAHRHWQHYRGALHFDPETADRVRQRILLARVREGRAPAELAERWPPAGLDAQQRKALAEALALEALRRQRWDTALQWMTRLPGAAQREPRWLYWRARAMEAAGAQPTPPVQWALTEHTGTPALEPPQRLAGMARELARLAAADPSFGLVWTTGGNRAPAGGSPHRFVLPVGPATGIGGAASEAPGRPRPPALRDGAEAIYAHLARQRGYYGFLAAHRTGRRYALASAQPALDPELVRRVEALPGVQRALELRALNELPEARLEWRWASRRLSDAELVALAEVGRRHDWHRLSVQAAMKAERWSRLDLRFPLAFSETMLDYARRRNLEPSWVYAVARQESAFMTDARSGAGALGLMQVMPATARRTARRFDIALTSNWHLLDPGKNIEIGTRYLAEMYERYGRNRVLASAAYNAGPGRVNRWLRERAPEPIDLWIELIPFRETRGYVRNVLSFALIYSHRLGDPQPFLHAHET